MMSTAQRRWHIEGLVILFYYLIYCMNPFCSIIAEVLPSSLQLYCGVLDCLVVILDELCIRTIVVRLLLLCQVWQVTQMQQSMWGIQQNARNTRKYKDDPKKLGRNNETLEERNEGVHWMMFEYVDTNTCIYWFCSMW